MYNVSGIIYRIFAVGGICLINGVIIFFCSGILNPKRHKKKQKHTKKQKIEFVVSLLIITYSIVYMSFFAYKANFPEIAAYEGTFISERRYARVAPQTYRFAFKNEQAEIKRDFFYMDSFSEKDIFPEGFVKGNKYVVFYEKDTKIIVKVESLIE